VPRTRIDGIADIGVACRDDAIERRHDVLEGPHRLQLSHVGLGGIGDRLLRRRIAARNWFCQVS
jgi:hypothetical protein